MLLNINAGIYLTGEAFQVRILCPHVEQKGQAPRTRSGVDPIKLITFVICALAVACTIHIIRL
jgi:hypothetical protein